MTHDYSLLLERIAFSLERMADLQDVMSRLQAQILVQGEQLLESNKRGIDTQVRVAAIYEMVTLTNRNEKDDANYDTNRRTTK